MKKFIFFTCLILVIHLIYGQSGGNFYYAEGQQHFFSTDSTSVNILVRNMQHYDTIAKAISAFYSDSSEYAVYYDNEDDNIIVSSKSIVLRNIDSLLQQLAPNNNDIAFISYAKQIGGSHFWLRNEVYVKYRDSLQAVADLSNVLSLYTVEQVVYEGDYEYRLIINDENQLLNLANSLYDTSKVIYSTPDFYGEIELNTSDTYFERQWGLLNIGQEGGQSGYDINAELAWDFLSDLFGNSTFPTIKVAVIDDGVENHEDMYDSNGQSKVLQGCTPGWTDHGAPVPKSKHGECCAGIIAASHNSIGIAGVAENTQIIPIRIFKRTNLKAFSYARIAKGITKAWKELGADILSNSWSEKDITVSNDKLNNAITKALSSGRNNKGCVVVFSSGNNNTFVNYPANQSGVIAVGGIERCGWRAGNHLTAYMCDHWNGSSYGSCFGSALSVVAPATNIWATDRQGNGYGYDEYSKYITFNGTSAACPHVSGVAALMLSVNPSLTQNQIHSIINSTAQKITHYEFVISNGHNDGTWNNDVGYGLVDAHKAVCEARLFGHSFAIQGATTVNTCSNYTYSLIGNLPPEFNIVWEVNPQMIIIEGQGTTQVLVKPVYPATGNTVVAHICHGGEIIRTIDNLGYIVSYGTNYSMAISSDSTLTSNIIWGDKRQLAYTLSIDSLATLTITDTLLCVSGSRIIVRPGGKLIVNGGTLTNACDGEMWEGIFVEGNRDLRQLATRQGSVILTNATIENARNAISTRGFEESTWWYKTGGIVQATNTLFRNNRRSVEFLDYENHKSSGGIASNASHFDRCTFTVDDDNLFAENDATFGSHVTMWKVRGVKFNGCTFRNETVEHVGLTRGSAITAEEAGFFAQRVCPRVLPQDPCMCLPLGSDTVTRCSFEGFHKAVNATNTFGNYDITLDNCDFAHNHAGATLSAADNARVSFCDFDLSDTLSYCGIELENSTGYTVEENFFHRQYNTNAYKVTGIYVGNSGTSENVIRKNSFSNVNWGIAATGTNALNSRTRIPGLQFECNSFAGGKTDISVNSGTVRGTQGSASAGADNVFTGLWSSQSIVLSAANNITYYYSNGTNHIPNNSSTGVTPVGSATANGCASSLCGMQVNPKGTGTALAQYRALAEEYADLAETWCTASLQPTDTMMPDNPQDAETATLQSRLSDLSAAMGDLARTEIRAILSDTVVDMALLKEWYRAIVEAWCTAPLQDTIQTDIPVAAYQLAEVYSHEGDYAAANAVLSSLPERFNPDEASRNEYGNYLALQRLRENVSGNWYRQTDTEIADLQRVAEYDNGRAARMAKEILCFFHHICYEDEPILPELSDGAIGERNARRDGARPVSTTTGNLTLHPNPAHTTLTVESDSPVREITIYDLTGKTMMTVGNCPSPATVNVVSLPRGIYLLRAVTEEGAQTARFVKN
jgi:subtilisin family serine protease